MRRVALLAILIPLAALAGVRAMRADRRARGGEPFPVFRLLRSGGGASSVVDLCDNFSHSLVGNYFCLRGDGTQFSNDAGTLYAVATPTTTTPTRCPNGPDCATQSAKTFNGTSQYYSTDGGVSAAPDDHSGCVLFRPKAQLVNQMLITKQGATGADDAFIFYMNSSNGLTLDLSKSSGNTTSINSAAALIYDEWHFVCYTYDFVADGSSMMKVYIDGAVSGAGSAVAVGPTQATATQPLEVARRTKSSGGNLYLTADIGNAFYTESLLSAADIAAMDKAVRPTVSGSFGETLTTTRSSSKYCTGSSGVPQLIRNATPCVVNQGVDVEAAATNLVLSSETLDTWARLFQVTVVADATTAPDGTTTADKVLEDTSTAVHGLDNGGITTTIGDQYTYSIFVKKGTRRWVRINKAGGAAANIWFDLDNVAVGTHTANQAGYITPAGNGWYRLCAVWDGAAIGGATTFFGAYLATADNTSSYLGTGTDYGYFWGQQAEHSNICSSYMPTGGTTVTRAADRYTVATTAAWPIDTGSVSATFTPNSSSLPAVKATIVSALDASGWEIYVDSTGALCLFLGGDGQSLETCSTALTWAGGTAYKLRAVWIFNPDEGTTNVYVYRDDALVASEEESGSFVVNAIGASGGIGFSPPDTSTSFANGIVSGVEVYR